MLVKLGVDTSRLHREIRETLNIVERQFNLYNWEAVVCCTYEGTHEPGSLHYADDAYHVSNPPHSQTLVIQSIRHEIGKDFEVVQGTDHIHIEFNPKKKRPIPKGTV